MEVGELPLAWAWPACWVSQVNKLWVAHNNSCCKFRGRSFVQCWKTFRVGFGYTRNETHSTETQRLNRNATQGNKNMGKRRSQRTFSDQFFTHHYLAVWFLSVLWLMFSVGCIVLRYTLRYVRLKSIMQSITG